MASGDDEDLLLELLLRWDERRREGREASAEEICGQHPRLATELGRRIRALQAMDAPLRTQEVITPADRAPATVPSGGEETGSPPPNTTAPPGARYRRLQLHARGGLGELYVAHDQELNREVALKEIQDLPARDPICRSRFLFEAEVTAGLEHPGIVPVHGLGQYPDGRPYYAMRLIRGESLKEAIDRLHAAGDRHDRSRDLRLLLRRFLTVCDAVAYAHSRGVIHRDLKPANIMLGRYGETLVVDWGLAKRVGRPDDDAGVDPGAHLDGPALRPRAVDGTLATQPGGASGTPAYMSPEQAGGEVDRLGPASDIYSLGATLYSLLTGKAPVHGKDALTILGRVRRGEFPPPRSIAPDVPRPLEATCLKAMALAPEARYPAVQALADDLEKWLAGEAVSAYPEPRLDRIRRWLGRRRTLVAATAVGIVIALFSLGAGVILLADANRRERELRADAVAEEGRAEGAERQALAEKDRAERAQQSAEAEALRAREEARKATQLSDFLVQLFQSSDPLGLEGQGFREPSEGVKDLTALQLLRRGADRIEIATRPGASDGAADAGLMDTIGNALRVLGDYERARPLIEAAWKARRDAPRPDPRGLADSVFHLGILAHDSLDVEIAESRYREAMALYEGSEGADGPGVLRVKFRLGWLLAMERRLDEAERLFRTVLARREAQLGAGHIDVQNVRLALVLVSLERGDRMALLTKAKGLLGRDGLVAGTMLAYTRAMAFRLAHNYPVARRLYEEVLVTARKNLPSRHILLAVLLGDMAGMYRETGELARAEELMREALEIGRRTIPLHPLMIEGLTAFADEMARQGRIEEAERHYLEAIELGRRRGRPSPSDDRWRQTLERLVRMEQDRGRTAKADEYRRLFEKR